MLGTRHQICGEITAEVGRQMGIGLYPVGTGLVLVVVGYMKDWINEIFGV